MSLSPSTYLLHGIGRATCIKATCLHYNLPSCWSGKADGIRYGTHTIPTRFGCGLIRTCCCLWTRLFTYCLLMGVTCTTAGQFASNKSPHCVWHCLFLMEEWKSKQQQLLGISHDGCSSCALVKSTCDLAMWKNCVATMRIIGCAARIRGAIGWSPV